jgi:NAD(P)-dependent dehydrogenase (short-subunit alcohol dehydrogenase family)
MGLLTGKVALVTGGGRGIGRAIADLFSSEGATVVVAGRTVGELERAAAEIGGDSFTLRLDVTSAADWGTAVAELGRVCGKLDVLVNNAGFSEATGLENASDEHWRRHMAVNLDGVFYGCRAALPLMLKTNGPVSVINVSSTFGQRPVPQFAAYCASKAGMTMLTKVLALEFASKGYPIRVNTVHPGGTETEMVIRAYEQMGMSTEQREAFARAMHPMGRLARPEEVAKACLWLASEASSFTTGIELNVDGGSLIRS